MTTNLFLLATFIAVMILMSINHKKKKKRIVFFGDSITEQGDQRIGFISIIKDFIRAKDEEEKYDVFGAGIGGNKVADLLQRVDKDVLARGADVVVIFVGVNDAWHKRLIGRITPYDEFERDYKALIKKLTEAEIKIIVCTPAVIGEKARGTNELDEELENYCAIIHSIAEDDKLTLVDLRKSFLAYNIENNSEDRGAHILTMDGVHLNDKGNELVAREIWNVLKEIR
jgi:lysophospholipase L1-like esterase